MQIRAAAKLEIISATRRSLAEFTTASALGMSLQRLAADTRIVARIACDNTRGLPAVYNEQLAAAADDSIVVFMHDDVWIDDYHFSQRIAEALDVYDVVGIAGNRRRIPYQPAWAFLNTRQQWDDREHLSGAIGAGRHPFGTVNRYGATPAACELLDGVLLAARKATLIERGIGFDPRFDFDFYDMDFCRTARQKNLRLGTWPICVTHQSDGVYGSEKWLRAYRVYLAKWGD